MQETILQTVGHTPLVRLRRMATDVPCPVGVKVESSNPGGSVKDRVGLAMIAEAERRGWLQPGSMVFGCRLCFTNSRRSRGKLS